MVVNKLIRRGSCHFIKEAHVHIRFVGISVGIEEFHAHAGGGEGGLDSFVKHVVEGRGIVGVKIFPRAVQGASTRQPQANNKRPEEHTSALQFQGCCAGISIARLHTIGDQDKNISVALVGREIRGRLKQRIGNGRYTFWNDLSEFLDDLIMVAGAKRNFKLGILAIVGLPGIAMAVYP